jgi:hypothetical protein
MGNLTRSNAATAGVTAGAVAASNAGAMGNVARDDVAGHSIEPRPPATGREKWCGGPYAAHGPDRAAAATPAMEPGHAAATEGPGAWRALS